MHNGNSMPKFIVPTSRIASLLREYLSTGIYAFGGKLPNERMAHVADMGKLRVMDVRSDHDSLDC
jgi:hypothetical protein